MSELKIILQQQELEFYLDPEDHTGWETFYLKFAREAEKREIREWVHRCCKEIVIVWSGGTILSKWQIDQMCRHRPDMSECMEKILAMAFGGEYGWQIYFQSAQDAAMFKITFMNANSSIVVR